MIIRRIHSLSGGVWNYTSSSAAEQFAPRTLIYGFNGTGKTTLSRVFSSIEREVLEERLPDQMKFKIELSDGSIIESDKLHNAFGKNLLVFNGDFVSRNFEWDSCSTKGIIYLSEKKIDAHRSFDEMSRKYAGVLEKINLIKKDKARAEKALSDFKTRVARNIRDVVSSSKYTQSYDARQIHSNYSKRTFGAEGLLADERLNQLQALLAQREPLPAIEFSPQLPNGLNEWFQAARPLLTQSIGGILLQEFEAHAEALRWAEEGLNYHENTNLMTASFVEIP